jgi:hypothetical protein
MRRDLIGIEHQVGDTVIEYTFFDSDIYVRSGYLKEEP